MDQNKESGDPVAVAMLGLQALANYVAGGLVREGEEMHRDLAVRLANTVNRGKW